MVLEIVVALLVLLKSSGCAKLLKRKRWRDNVSGAKNAASGGKAKGSASTVPDPRAGKRRRRMASAGRRVVGEFTVVAWDANGCGSSSDPPESSSWRTADAMAAVHRHPWPRTTMRTGSLSPVTFLLHLQRHHPPPPTPVAPVGEMGSAPRFGGWGYG